MAASHFTEYWRIGKSELLPQPKKESEGSLKNIQGAGVILFY